MSYESIQTCVVFVGTIQRNLHLKVGQQMLG